MVQRIARRLNHEVLIDSDVKQVDNLQMTKTESEAAAPSVKYASRPDPMLSDSEHPVLMSTISKNYLRCLIV
ncbi:hypothetical protein [Streptococcus equi]|uniref:hypothetical protein n=1 Tax=Streptococcus equi TaxID=1336 RepID=UPI001E3406EC|nr:hypothetical protein [Streptococcus equi]